MLNEDGFAFRLDVSNLAKSANVVSFRVSRVRGPLVNTHNDPLVEQQLQLALNTQMKAFGSTVSALTSTTQRAVVTQQNTDRVSLFHTLTYTCMCTQLEVGMKNGRQQQVRTHSSNFDSRNGLVDWDEKDGLLHRHAGREWQDLVN